MKFKVNADCRMCGGNVHHEVELDGDALSWFREQLEVAGVAPISVDHGDHVMVVYLDKRGCARSSYTYPVVKEAIAGEKWIQIQGAAVPSDADVLFANWREKKYCTPRWSTDTPPEFVLSYAETARVASLEGREFWVLASGDNRMVVAKAVGWQRNLFQMMQEMLSQATLAEPNILASPAAQAVLASAASNPFMYNLNSASIFVDLRRRVRASRALKLLNGRIEADLYALLESLERYDTLGECLLSATPKQIALLARNYRSLRNTGVISVV
ncbi:MAG: hypothetical protein QXN15_11645 [Candidatus Jordarchaeales archaeon]|nr:hypothetical protein [Candidatus Jordarchaeia archaeon]